MEYSVSPFLTVCVFAVDLIEAVCAGIHRGGMKKNSLTVDDANYAHIFEWDHTANRRGNAAEDVLKLQGLGGDVSDLTQNAGDGFRIDRVDS